MGLMRGIDWRNCGESGDDSHYLRRDDRSCPVDNQDGIALHISQLAMSQVYEGGRMTEPYGINKDMTMDELRMAYHKLDEKYDHRKTHRDNLLDTLAELREVLDSKTKSPPYEAGS